MERFEYRLVEAPSESRKYTGSSKADDLFAHTVMDGMNELAREGWQFLRTETLMERRRKGIFARKTLVHEYMVYRRALNSGGMSLADPVNPKRIRRAASPDIYVLRNRISGLIRAESQNGGAAA